MLMEEGSMDQLRPPLHLPQVEIFVRGSQARRKGSGRRGSETDGKMRQWN